MTVFYHPGNWFVLVHCFPKETRRGSSMDVSICLVTTCREVIPRSFLTLKPRWTHRVFLFFLIRDHYWRQNFRLGALPKRPMGELFQRFHLKCRTYQKKCGMESLGINLCLGSWTLGLVWGQLWRLNCYNWNREIVSQWVMKTEIPTLNKLFWMCWHHFMLTSRGQLDLWSGGW